MKTGVFKTRCRAFTQTELLVVIVTCLVLVFVGLIVPLIPTPHVGARIRCVSNLRELGLAFRVWSADHGDKFPTAVSTDSGGLAEMVSSGATLPIFLAISNEWKSPRILACPCDKKRQPARHFDLPQNQNLSYFVGLDANEFFPATILSGDRNVSTNERILSGILTLTSNTPALWTKDIHIRCGNIGLADGSAQQVKDDSLNAQVLKSPGLPIRFSIP